MISKPKSREEWQKIVNDFNSGRQSKKDYCQDRNIKYGTFKYWYLKLKPSVVKKEEGVGSKLEISEVRQELPKKEFIGFKLLNATKIELPNGISIEVATVDVIGLIKKLMHVA